MKNTLVKYLPLILLTGACRPKPIDIKVKAAPEKLVISSTIVPNQIMVISLTKSFSALESQANSDTVSNAQLEKVLVKGAFVTVSYAGRTDTLEELSDGVYGSATVLLSNYRDYFLYARDNATGQEITATTSMMPYKTFDTINVYKSPKGVCTVHYRLTDDVSNKNYYVVNFVRKLNNNNSSGIQRYFVNGNGDFENYMELLTDESFTNGVYENTKELSSVGPADSIAVSVANISRGYYEFLSAFKRSGNFINALTAEPIHFPTNVNNGYGFFNAYYPQVKVYNMAEY